MRVCVGVVDLGVDQWAGPGCARVCVDEERPHQQRHRDGEEGAQRAEQERPDDQGHVGHLGAQADRVADVPRLDERLDRDVEDAVDDYDQHHLLPSRVKEGEQTRRDDADHEADVGDEVRDEGEEAPDQRERHRDQPQCRGVQHSHDGAEEGCHHEVLLGAVDELGQRCRELWLRALEPGNARLESPHGDDEEEHHGHQEEQPPERPKESGEDVGQKVGDLGGVDLLQCVARRLGAEPEVGQPVVELVGQGLRVLGVLREHVDQLHQADDGAEQEHGQDRVRRDEREQSGQPAGPAVATRPGTDRENSDGQHQRQHRGRDDPGGATDAGAQDDDPDDADDHCHPTREWLAGEACQWAPRGGRFGRLIRRHAAQGRTTWPGAASPVKGETPRRTVGQTPDTVMQVHARSGVH